MVDTIGDGRDEPVQTRFETKNNTEGSARSKEERSVGKYEKKRTDGSNVVNIAVSLGRVNRADGRRNQK